jgi:putative redox protein
MDLRDAHLASAHLDSGTARYAQRIRVGRHELTADEPPPQGGADAGPAPYGLLLASLAACTSITLRMYADRKGWELGPVHVDLAIDRHGDVERIDRTIRLSAALTDEQRARLAEIADKTPVTRTLARGTAIETTIVVGGAS